MNLPPHLAGAVSFAFGDGPALADELLGLVLAGEKTATCGDLRQFGEAELMPEVGRRDVVLDGQGRPAAVIETKEVRVLPFDAVDEGFALEEGEGSYAEWRRAHEIFFARNLGFDPKMEVVCERFRVVEVLERDEPVDPLAGLPRFAFGSGAAMADELLGLILAGEMTASCMAERNVGRTGPLPVLGGRSLVLDGAGHPGAIIETTEVRRGPLSSVDIAFVRDEGEGIATTDAWIARHVDFFAESGPAGPDLPVIFERLRLVRALLREE